MLSHFFFKEVGLVVFCISAGVLLHEHEMLAI